MVKGRNIVVRDRHFNLRCALGGRRGRVAACGGMAASSGSISSGVRASGTATASGMSSASGRAVSAQSTTAWKSESEETVKTRRNALRVIVQKLRNFWPADKETRLTDRATILEQSVFDVTASKEDYIKRLQRDLQMLSSKKELEKKNMRLHMQQASDIFAQHAQDDSRVGAVPPNLTADVKAKFVQKIYTMEKKHVNKLYLLKTSEDRLRHSPHEQKIKEWLTHFKTMHQLRDKGPYDLKKLNEIDEQLDKCASHPAFRSHLRVPPNRETINKQNDRTNVIGSRFVEKMRKLNNERPFVVAEVRAALARESCVRDCPVVPLHTLTHSLELLRPPSFAC